MSEIRKIKEFTTTVLKTKITGLSDEIARDYQECTVKIIGLNARQTIDLKIEAVNDGKTTTIFAQKITVGKEVHLVGPFKIDRRCQIAISGDVTGQLVNPAHCKIESVISYDDSSMRTLRLGVFFDDTGCNASNSEKYSNSFSSIGDYLESLIEKVNDSIIPKSYRYTPQLSYVSGLSNIWNLYRSFTEGRIDEKTYQAKTYIECTGTKKDALDSMFTMGTGWSPPVGPQTGVIAKTDDAVQQIKDLLAKLGNDFDRVELYIFGFSRGSTSARHFANRIAHCFPHLTSKNTARLRSVSSDYMTLLRPSWRSLKGILMLVTAKPAMSTSQWMTPLPKTSSTSQPVMRCGRITRQITSRLSSKRS